MRTFIIIFSLLIITCFQQNLRAQRITTRDYENKTKKEKEKKESLLFGEIAMGPHYMISPDANEDFGWGIYASGRLRIDTRKKRLSFTPMISLASFNVPMPDNSEVNNNLDLIKLGVQFNFVLFRSASTHFVISNYLNTKYAFINNKLTWQVNTYSIPSYNSSSTKTETFEIFDGNGFSAELGYKFQYQFVFVEIGYDILQSRVTLSPALENAYRVEDIEYDPNPTLDFNTLNINVGFSIPLSGLFSIW